MDDLTYNDLLRLVDVQQKMRPRCRELFTALLSHPEPLSTLDIYSLVWDTDEDVDCTIDIPTAVSVTLNGVRKGLVGSGFCLMRYGQSGVRIERDSTGG